MNFWKEILYKSVVLSLGILGILKSVPENVKNVSLVLFLLGLTYFSLRKN